MAVKIYELAKEFEVSSKEMLERITSMGVEAKSHMSSIPDDIASKLREAISREKANEDGSETKIVKMAGKRSASKESEDPRVSVKPASVKPVSPLERSRAIAAERQAAAGKAAQSKRPPLGKPIVSKELENRVRPVGKPIVPVDLEERKAAQKAKAELEAAQKAKEEEEAKKLLEEQKKEAETAAAETEPKAEEAVSPEKAEEAKPSEDAKAAEEVKASEEVKAAEEVKTGEDSKDKAAEPSAPIQPSEEYIQISTGQTLKIISRASDRKKEEKEKREREKAQREKDNKDRKDRKDGERGSGRDAGRKGDKDRTRDAKRSDRPAQGGRGAQPSAQASSQGSGSSSKGGQKHSGRDDKKKADRNKDSRFDRMDGGKAQSKRNLIEMSLEKTPKPKKHVKKEKPVEEPKIDEAALPSGTRVINVPITVAGFCEQTEVSTSQAIMALMKMGVMANINQNLNEDTVLILADELGINVVIGNIEEEEQERGIEVFDDREEDLVGRPPIITVMGHVDHGKTSLLDAIRKTHVTASESGGITQHIGASEVVRNGQRIVFLDTPGHEAFTAMRARGAHITDIAVLVVAADDSVKPQTIESISHAKAAGVPVIVAINKMDKPGANPDKVKQDLTEHGILVEEWGGDTICVPVSAKAGTGIDDLLDMILLQAEVLELKANPNRLALGTVIEARLDKTKGPIATLLVMNGTLEQGQSLVAGTCAGKIRLMTNSAGKVIKKAGPATAVEILGLTDVPQAGDEFNAVREDKLAREIAESRKEKLREEVLARNASTTLEALFSQIQEGEIKELNLIVKADVQGSVGAIVSSLEKLSAENVRVKIIHTGVGTVNESDIMLAETSGAVILGFNVRPSAAVTAEAERAGVEIRTYRVIYDMINDVEDAMKGMLDPVFKEQVLGQVEVRETFRVPGVGIIAGAYVTDGKVQRNAEVRLVRDGIVIHEGRISSLKRFKDDVREVATGYECGIGIENYDDIKIGDVIECFEMQEVKRD